MNRQERLKEYIALVARSHGGVDKLVEDVRSASGHEAPAAPGVGGFEAMTRPQEKQAAIPALAAAAKGAELTPEQMAAVEAIIDEDLRPAFDVVGGTFEASHPLWVHLSRDTATRQLIESCLPSVGRVELPGHPRLPYGGTGFVVGNDLLMTNRHVAEVFATGLGDREIRFRPGLGGGVDFLREFGRPTGPTLKVHKVRMIHPYWDMALLEVPGIGEGRAPLRLSLMDARDLVARPIFVVGYPAFDPRNPADVQNRLFGSRYGIKRLQPGELQGGAHTGSFGKLVPAATHDCSTLGGNSGSAVVDLATGHVMALHFGGAYHQRNYAVPSAALARDGRVVDAGVLFAGTPSPGLHDWASWWKRADDGEAVAFSSGGGDGGGSTGAGPAAQASSPPAAAPGRGVVIRAQGGGVTIRIAGPAEIDVGAAAGSGIASGSMQEDALEALREPWHDEDYGGRSGYDPTFLGDDVAVPLPDARDASVLARTVDGETVLRYQNFAIAMHAARRLALFTASNISREPQLRRPKAGRPYGRKDLGGLGENDQEKWFLDPRMDAKHQLPDVFFTRDRKAFDKGHLVRREDIAWGTTYEELRRANGDSYHVTNCSPQVADFNRSNLGEVNWGDLENLVLASAASERLCVFAGPVLSGDDQVFVGAGGGSARIRARIPSAFWKVIVCRQGDGIAAFGFVLEQDLSRVEWEFVVAEEFLPALHPVSHIEEITGIDFGGAVRAADQYGIHAGTELALNGVQVWRP